MRNIALLMVVFLIHLALLAQNGTTNLPATNQFTLGILGGFDAPSTFFPLGEAPIVEALHGRTFGLRGAHYQELYKGLTVGLVANAVRSQSRFQGMQQSTGSDADFTYNLVRFGFEFTKGFQMAERLWLGFNAGYGMQQSFWQVPEPVRVDNGILNFGGAGYRPGIQGINTDYISLGTFSDFGLSNGRSLRLGLHYLVATNASGTIGTYHRTGTPDTAISGYLKSPRSHFLVSLSWQFNSYERNYEPPIKPNYDPESVPGLRQRIQELRAIERKKLAAEVFNKGWWLSVATGYGMNSSVHHNFHWGNFKRAEHLTLSISLRRNMNRNWYNSLQIGLHNTYTELSMMGWYHPLNATLYGFNIVESSAMAGYRIHLPDNPIILNLEAGIGLGMLLPIRNQMVEYFSDSLFLTDSGGSPGHPTPDGEITINYAARNNIYLVLRLGLEHEVMLNRKTILFVRLNRSIGLVPVTALDIHTSGSQKAGTYTYHAHYLGGNTDLSAGLRFRIH